MAQFEVSAEPVAEAMALGRAHGKLTICNPAPARSVDPAMFANVDILTPNATEARMLLGLPPDDPSPAEDLARALLDFGVLTVIVTLGKQGALIVTVGKAPGAYSRPLNRRCGRDRRRRQLQRGAGGIPGRRFVN